jgi:hypothetical protein
MTLARVVSNQSVKRRLMPLACQEGIESQPDKELFCHLSSNISFFLIFFFLLQGGSRVEVKNLVWSSDKVTTILGNASGDRIHICTLVGHAQLFHDFGESVNPTRLLFFGLPGSVASAKVSKQLRIYTLVHLCQLHVTRSMRSDGSVMDWRRVRERTGYVGRSIFALRTMDNRVVEMLMMARFVSTLPVGQLCRAHCFRGIELVAVG